MKRYSIKIKKINSNSNEVNSDFSEINTDNIKCTGKSFINMWLTFLFGFTSIVCLITFSKAILFDLQGILSYLAINLIFILPLIYFLLKIKNYKFEINNDKIIYKNTFGNVYEYKIREIKYIKRIIRRRPETFLIKLKNQKNIIVSDYSTNFDRLKLKFQKENLI